VREVPHSCERRADQPHQSAIQAYAVETDGFEGDLWRKSSGLGIRRAGENETAREIGKSTWLRTTYRDAKLNSQRRQALLMRG
jgi:hypothetical protein